MGYLGSRLGRPRETAQSLGQEELLGSQTCLRGTSTRRDGDERPLQHASVHTHSFYKVERARRIAW